VGEILKGNRGSGCQTLSPRELVTCLSERGPRLENLRPGRNRGSLPHRELRFEIPSVDAEQRLPFSYAIPDLAEDFPDDTADRSADSNVSGAGFEHAGAGDVARIGRDGRWRDRLGHKRRRASALSLLKMIAVVTVTSPRTQTRNVREEAKVVRSIYFPVPISVLITGS